MRETNPTLAAPLDFSPARPAAAVGMTRDGIQQLADLFEQQFQSHLPGAQLVVLRQGQVVFDRTGGLADLGRREPVTPHTSFLVFSIAKSFTAMAIHKLIEQGRVDFDAPVATYWPEFGRHGKETATIRHTLLHQAGIPSAGMHWQVPLWPNWGLVTRSVARTPAEFEPGTQSAYHLVNYGFILGEVVRRVTGQPVERYVAETLLQPLGLVDSYLGAPPASTPRPAKLYAGAPEERSTAFVFNLPFIRRAVQPAAVFHTTARDLAVFFQLLLNCGSYGGQQLFQPETVTAALSLGFEGHDASVEMDLRWAYGFHLGGQDIPYGRFMGKGSTSRTFGHFGQRSSMAWADPDSELVVALTCNRLLSSADSRARWQSISNAVWDAVA